MEAERMNFSKSKYCGLWQCPKIAWLQKYKPEELKPDDSILARMQAGNEVGDLAMGLFGDFTEVTEYDGEKPDLSRMIEKTRDEMEKGTPVICEASFAYEGLYCAVDILRKEGGGWAIYEVKSSSRHEDRAEEKPVYIADIAYQKYVLGHCGVTVTGTYLVCINGDYVRDGELDLRQLFRITDVSGAVASEEASIADLLRVAETILSSEEEPDIGLSVRCNDPYRCGFWKYCARHVPEPSVFDLYRLPFKKMIEYYQAGLTSFPVLRASGVIGNEKQLRQIAFALEDKGIYTDRDAIRKFLGTLSYPLYFLDFETMQPVIPLYSGTRPYMQIPFQYSLHYIETEGGTLRHKEFLGRSGEDPRRAIAEQLCADIPMDVCVTAYNKSFECTRIKELAETFPDLSGHLMNIRDHIVDLLTPFQSGYYYCRAMGGSFSIKSVLPALYPDDPELDYHNLEGVHNGGEAMTVFPKIQYMPPDGQAAARRNLLRYCELDTYAMVKVWQVLVRAAQ